MNPTWLFHHIVEALRSPSNRPRPRDVYCPEWLAVGLGVAGLGFLVALIAAAFPR
jgi:dipeptide/tripeptide permease